MNIKFNMNNIESRMLDWEHGFITYSEQNLQYLIENNIIQIFL